MGVKNTSGVRIEVRRGKRLRIIDFRYKDKSGHERRYRRDASGLTHAAAVAEARKLRDLAATNGTLDAGTTMSPTFADFVAGPFEVLYMPKYRPATRVRYRALLGQGIQQHFGEMRLDQISTSPIATYAVGLLERGVQTRAHVNLVRTVLRAAKDTGVLERLPDFPSVTSRVT